MRRDRAPHYRWIIWRGIIYFPNGYHEPYFDKQDQHYDHVHVTFW